MIGERAQPVADAVLDPRQALGVPGCVALEEDSGFPLQDRRLDRAQRGEHPGDGARPGICLVGQEAAMALGDMEHDRA